MVSPATYGPKFNNNACTLRLLVWLIEIIIQWRGKRQNTCTTQHTPNPQSTNARLKIQSPGFLALTAFSKLNTHIFPCLSCIQPLVPLLHAHLNASVKQRFRWHVSSVPEMEATNNIIVVMEAQHRGLPEPWLSLSQSQMHGVVSHWRDPWRGHTAAKLLLSSY